MKGLALRAEMDREIHPKKINLEGMVRIQIHQHFKHFTEHPSHLTTLSPHTGATEFSTLPQVPCFPRVHHVIHDLVTASVVGCEDSSGDLRETATQP